MSGHDYKHNDRDGDRLTVQKASEGAIWLGVNNELAHVSATKRREVAQAIAGDEWGVIPAAEAAAPDGALSLVADALGTDDLGEIIPAIERLKDECERLKVQAAGEYGPADIERARSAEAKWMLEDLHSILHALTLSTAVRASSPHEVVEREIIPAIWRLRARADTIAPYLLVDLWQALGGDPADFDDWHTRHGSTDTWGQLLAIVRRAFQPVCGKPVDGEYCVLTAPRSESDLHICHGPSDVGTEELPPIPAVQPDGPEPVDTSEVRVGDRVEITYTGVVRRKTSDNRVITFEGDGEKSEVYYGTADATVRVLRPAVPDPPAEEVAALEIALTYSMGDKSDEYLHNVALDLARRNVRVVSVDE